MQRRAKEAPRDGVGVIEEASDSLRLWFLLKAACVYLLLALDCVINSMAEFNDFSNLSKTTGVKLSVTSIIMCQLVVQFAEMLILFTMMGATYLFSNGLLSILFGDFKIIFILNPSYLAYTLALGSARALLLEDQDASVLESLWLNGPYAVFSIMHKLAAVYYFVVNVRIVRQLGEPKYYSKEDWVAVYKHSKA